MVGGLLFGEFVFFGEINLIWDVQLFEVVDHLNVEFGWHVTNVEQHIDQLDVAALAEVGVDKAGPALLFAFRTRGETITWKINKVNIPGIEKVDSGGLTRFGRDLRQVLVITKLV